VPKAPTYTEEEIARDSKLVGIVISPQLHRKVRKKAADEEVPMSELWVKAMLRYLEVSQ